MDKVQRNVSAKQCPVDSQHRVSLNAIHFALRSTIGSLTLAPPDKVRQGIVHDRYFRLRRPRLEKQLLISVHHLSDRTRHPAPVCQRSVQLDQAEPARFISSAHRIPGVVIDRLRASRQRAPRPDANVLRSHCRRYVQRHRSETALQLTDPEPAAAFRKAKRPRKVEQRSPPFHIAIYE